MSKNHHKQEIKWYQYFLAPNIAKIRAAKKIQTREMVTLMFFAGSAVMCASVARYLIQVLVLHSLPGANNATIVQSASPLTTIVLWAGALINSPLASRWTLRFSDRDHHQRSEILVTGIIYSMLITGAIMAIHLALIEPFIFLQNSKISAANYQITHLYTLILVGAVLFNSLNSMLVAIFVSSGYVYSVSLASLTSVVVGVVSAVLLVQYSSAGILSIPIAIVIYFFTSLLFLLIHFIIKEMNKTTIVSFRVIELHRHFKRALLIMLLVLSIGVSSRYVLQLITGLVMNSIFGNIAVPYGDVTNNHGHILTDYQQYGVSSIYWQAAFGFFYQIFLLFLIISFGVAQGARVVVGIVASQKVSNEMLKVIKLTFTIIGAYYIIITIIMLGAGGAIAQGLGLKNDEVLTINGKQFEIKNLIGNCSMIFYICSPTIIFSGLTFIITILCQINYQPIIAIVAVAIKNTVVIVLSLILMVTPIATNNSILIFLPWPIGDLLCGAFIAVFVSLYFSLVKKSKKGSITVTWKNIKRYLLSNKNHNFKHHYSKVRKIVHN